MLVIKRGPEARWVTGEEFLAMDQVFDGDRAFFERILLGL
ncbi:hypothetical protein GCM10022206_86170 [Streptomyces chiangmaiensis]